MLQIQNCEFDCGFLQHIASLFESVVLPFMLKGLGYLYTTCYIGHDQLVTPWKQNSNLIDFYCYDFHRYT